MNAHDLRYITRGQLEAVSRAYHRAVQVSDYEGMTRCLGLFDLIVDVEDESVGKNIFRDGYWESWNTVWMCKNIKFGDTCLDIGANMGYFTMLMSNLAGTLGKVHAFEPNPYYSQSINRSLAQNKYTNVYVHPVALSDKMGTATLSIPGNLRGSASIVIDFKENFPDEYSFEVPTRRLDSYVFRAVDLMKIDAEGAEQLILAGAEDIIFANHSCTIFMEWDSRRFADTEFARDIWARYTVNYVDLEGCEIPMSEFQLNNSSDIEMLVLRRK